MALQKDAERMRKQGNSIAATSAFFTVIIKNRRDIMKGRKSGCPVNIRNWIIEIQDKADNSWLRIYGLTSLTRNIESETGDGSSTTDVWKEPYITKRGGKAKLEGKPVVEAATGERDQGQEMLDSYAELSGCDADATLRFTDPYGHAFMADYVITNSEQSADEDGEKVSWDLEQVGEAEPLPYVHITSVTLQDNGEAITNDALSMTVGSAAKILALAFTPENASNKRYKVANSRKSVAIISNITEAGFTVTAVAAGTTNITVTTIEGNKTYTLAVTVTAGT